MALKLITAPAAEPLSLAEAKLHLRVDHADEDTLITALIVAARGCAEHETGRALVTQTWELVLDAFPEAFVLRKPPIASVTSVKYIDPATGAEQTLDLADTLLDEISEPGYLVPAYGKAWPEARATANAVRVRYVCGYGNAAAVPAAIKQWMLLAIGTMYEQRGTAVAGTFAPLPDRFWGALLDPYRLYEAL